MGVAIFFLQQARQQRPLQVPSVRTVLLLLLIFALAWIATLIACFRGGTTMFDDRPKGHLATSFVVGSLTAFIAFIVLLLAGFFV